MSVEARVVTVSDNPEFVRQLKIAVADPEAYLPRIEDEPFPSWAARALLVVIASRDTCVRAEAVADERQRIIQRIQGCIAALPGVHNPGWDIGMLKAIDLIYEDMGLGPDGKTPAAGSVPVAIPLAAEPRTTPGSIGHLTAMKRGDGPVATPTEPWCEQHGRVHCPPCISRPAARAIRGRGGLSGGGHPEPVDGILTAEPTVGPQTPSGTGGSSCTE